MENNQTVSPVEWLWPLMRGGWLQEVLIVRIWLVNIEVLERWPLVGGGRLQEMVTYGGLPVAQKLTWSFFTLLF